MKNIPFANSYYVTEDGDVYSDKSGKLKLLKSHVDSSTYRRIKLVTNTGTPRKYLVHRLVAICYIDNPHNLPEVNHKDGDKLHNHKGNLEWVTREENQKHAFSTGLNTNVGGSNGRCILSESQVLLIHQKLLDGYLVVDLAREFNVTNAAIKNIKSKKNWDYILKDLPEIPKNHKSSNISKSTAHWVCDMLSSGHSVKNILSLSTNARLTEDIVRDIKRRRTFKDVSSIFIW